MNWTKSRALLFHVCCCVLLSTAPRTVACQAPLSVGFSSKNIWVSCHFLLPGKSSLPFELRGRVGDCSRVTAGKKRPHLGLCPGQNQDGFDGIQGGFLKRYEHSFSPEGSCHHSQTRYRLLILLVLQWVTEMPLYVPYPNLVRLWHFPLRMTERQMNWIKGGDFSTKDPEQRQRNNFYEPDSQRA